MSRHRNVRQLGLDDISLYDEALASSLDDDSTVSPNSVEYLFDRNKQDFRAVSLFASQSNAPLQFTAEDFPMNEALPNDGSPGYVTGRIHGDIPGDSDQFGVLDAVQDNLELTQRITGDTNNAHPLTFPIDEFRVSSPPIGMHVPFNNPDVLDFDLLEQLVAQKVSPLNPLTPVCTTLSGRSAHSIVASSPVPHFEATILSKSNMDRLKSGLTFVTKHHLSPAIVMPSGNSRLLPNVSKSRLTSKGCKPSSRLGYRMTSSYTRSRRSFGPVDLILLGNLHLFIRSRATSLYDLLQNNQIGIEPFRFNVPEPLVSDRPARSVTGQFGSFLPSPRQKNRSHTLVTSERSEPRRSAVVPTPEESVSSTNLATCLQQKLTVSQPKERQTPTRPLAAGGPTPSSPSKPIDRKPLIAEYLARQKSLGVHKDVVNLIVVGHVDAGKSTLMGNLLCRLGHVSKKQLAKYRWEAQKLGKSSFAYAWVLDQTSEERNRGVTMDIAQTSFATKCKRVVLMDAPGHKDFVPRVIGGASQADVALLVVNATNGEFETGFGVGGQTREHARLVRLLGVSRLIVAVNKMDTVNWDRKRFESIQTQMTSFLKTLGLSGTTFCPVSGLTGTNILPADENPVISNSVSDEEFFSWYKGPSLIDIIDSLPSPERTVDDTFRFVVSDIFKPAGLGLPVVAGRVISGGVSAGVGLATSRLLCQPSGLVAVVKSIRSLCSVQPGMETADADATSNFLDQSVKYAFAGDQVALVLSGIDPYQSLAPGDVITDPDNPVPLASRIRARILLFSVPQPVTRGYAVILYYHYTSTSANISKLRSMTFKENKMEKTVSKPRCLLGNCTADVEIIMDRQICVEIYEKCKPLGRFMLRVGGESIAGGTVTAILPPKKNRLVDM